MNDRSDADREFADEAKRLFDDSVDGLDAATRSQLNQRRQAALAELSSGRPAWIQWLPATGVAAAAVLALVMWTGNPSPEELSPEATASDFEILLDEDSLEMLEDLEFYSWIDLDDTTDETPAGEDQVG